MNQQKTIENRLNILENKINEGARDHSKYKIRYKEGNRPYSQTENIIHFKYNENNNLYKSQNIISHNFFDSINEEENSQYSAYEQDPALNNYIEYHILNDKNNNNITNHNFNNTDNINNISSSDNIIEHNNPNINTDSNKKEVEKTKTIKKKEVNKK